MIRKTTYVFMILIMMVSLALAQSLEEFFAAPLPNDPELVTGQLANGLRYTIKVNKKPENRIAYRLLVNVGSVQEEEHERGLAHFTEHMAFNGTKHFSRTELREYLNSIGLGFAGGLNAGTGQDFTVYQLSSQADDSEQVHKSFLILSDWASGLKLNDDEIESERGIIIEEWRMGQGADERMDSATRPVLYAGSRYADRSPIGTYEVLSTFKPETIRNFYRTWYRPDLQELIIVGDLDPKEMIKLIEKHFGSMTMPEKPKELGVFPIPPHEEIKAVVATDAEASNHRMVITWKHERMETQTVEDYYQSLCRSIYFDMLGNRLSELSQKPDCPYAYAYNFAYNTTVSGSSNLLYVFLNGNTGDKALQIILTEAERAKRHGFSQGEMDRAKQRILRNAERAMLEQNNQLSEQLVWRYVSDARRKNPMMSPQQAYALTEALLPRIDLASVIDLPDLLMPDKNMVIELTGPEKEELKYPESSTLIKIATEMRNAEIEPWVDEVIEEPLITEIPKAKKLKKEKLIPELGFKEWTLANGVKVYTKKTDFKADEILLSARKAGGYSVLPVQDMQTAIMCGEIVTNSGFGSFDQIRLGKALAGKIASGSFEVRDYSQAIRGSTSPQDLELMFQMLYQYIQAPRRSKDDFDSFIQRKRSFIENRLLDPESVFYDSLRLFFYDNNPYAKEINLPDLMSIKQDRAYEIFAQLYGDFKDFEFVIVGNFDEAKLKEMCNIYLANLPTGKSKIKAYKDLGLRIKPGKRNLVVNIGKDPKGSAWHVFSRPADFSSQEKLNVAAVDLVLDERLGERIREQMSGVYVVSSYFMLTKHPKPYFEGYAVLYCSPERMDELNTEIVKLLNDLKPGNITEEELTYVKNTLLRRLDADLISNRYWLNSAQNILWNKEDPAFYANYKDRINALTTKDLNATAQKYLVHDENLISGIKLPQQR